MVLYQTEYLFTGNYEINYETHKENLKSEIFFYFKFVQNKSNRTF